MHIIEEMVLFSEPQPVQHIELDPQRVNYSSDFTRESKATPFVILLIG